MKFYDFSILIVVAIVVVAAAVGIASQFFLSADNPIEEIAEEVIKVETGVDVDLSPGSHEIKK